MIERKVSERRTFLLSIAIVVMLMALVLPVSALVVDFKQCANDDNPTPPGECHWITSILQQSNSEYSENMAVGQRFIVTDIPTTSDNVHSLTFSTMATKGGAHGYDFLVSWNQSNDPEIVMNPCGEAIGPPNSLQATCNALLGAYSVEKTLPDDPFISKDGSTQQRIDAYEALYGDRTLIIYGNQGISNVQVEILGHSQSGDYTSPISNGGDTGSNSYVDYKITWTSTSSQIMIQTAGHTAVGGDGSGLSWGTGLGSGAISGGSWHFKFYTLYNPARN